MLGYLLGDTPYYTIIFLILPFIVSHQYLKLCVSYSLIMAVDHATSYTLAGDNFFLAKAIFDLMWLIPTFVFTKGKLFKILISVVLISLSVNIYTYLDISYHIVYEYWNEINFVLFECIIAALLSTSPLYNKLNIWLIRLANYITNKINIKRISLCEEK